uniref:glucuronosyltransferase n=1 Tax=Heterorhabditis bacteriophora TaxID=37862 RepID=A0A1I7WQ64_HETBA
MTIALQMISIPLFSIVLCSTMYYSDAYKILVFAPRFAHSHVNFMGNIADILSDAGHNVTVLQPILDINLSSSGTKKAKLITIAGSNNLVEMSRANELEDVWLSDPRDVMWIISKTQAFLERFDEACQTLLNNTALISELEQEHFDLGISELFEYCGLGLFHVIKTKAIVSASSTGLFEHIALDIGAPLVPSYVPGYY